MNDQIQTLPPTALIIGCGYVGRRLAALLIDRGIKVYGTARTPESAARLAPLGIRPLIAQVTQRLTLGSLRPSFENGPFDAYYLVPPGRAGADPSPEQVLLQGTRNAVSTINKPNLRRAILVSSTAVYGQTGNVAVSGDTPAEPADERGRMLVEAERNWLSGGPKFHVLRLSGIYGPDRVIGLAAVREQHPLVGNPEAMLNLIHVDDAAGLLLAMMSCESPGRIELGSDNEPATRIDYYTHLAGMVGSPAPRIMDDANAALQLGLNVDRLRRASSKTCDNGPTRARTGWSPKYASFREGLAAVMG